MPGGEEDFASEHVGLVSLLGASSTRARRKGVGLFCVDRPGWTILTALLSSDESGHMSTSHANTLVQPYLFFGGRCEEALEFYRAALGAQVEMLMRFNESPEPHELPECFADKIMHASVRIGATTLMASDGRCEGPVNFEGFSLSLTVPDEAEAERAFAALAEGGLVTMPLEKTFWARKFGLLQDRFGVGWMVSVAQC